MSGRSNPNSSTDRLEDSSSEEEDMVRETLFELRQVRHLISQLKYQYRLVINNKMCTILSSCSEIFLGLLFSCFLFIV